MARIEYHFSDLWQFKWLRGLLLGLVFVAPLYFGREHWIPFGTPKLFLIISSVVFGLVLLAWGMYGRRIKTWRVSFSALSIALGAYVVILGLSAVLGTDPQNSFFGTFGQSLSVMLIYATAVFAILVGIVARADKTFGVKLVTVSFISAIIVALMSWFRDFAVVVASKEGSTLGNSSYAGAYLLFNLCFAFALFFIYKRVWQRIGIAAGALIMVSCPLFFNADIIVGNIPLADALRSPLSLIGSAQGAVIGVVVGLWASLGLWLFRLRSYWFKTLGVGLLLGLLALIIFIGHQLSTEGSRVRDFFIEQKTETRLLFWEIAKQGFLDNPLLGAGFQNYADIYQEHFKPEIMSVRNTQEMWIAQPHNIFWEYMSTTGILGTVAYFGMFVVLLVTFFRNSVHTRDRNLRILSVVSFGVLIGYLIQNMFVFDVAMTYLMFFMLFGIGLSLERNARIFNISNMTLRRIWSLGIIAVAVLVFIVWVILPSHESKKTQDLALTNNLVKLPAALPGVQGISLMGNIRDMAYLYDKMFGIIQTMDSQLAADNKEYVLGAIDALIVNLERELESRPEHYRANLVLGKLLNLYTMTEDKNDSEIRERADAYLNRALETSPGNPHTFLALAQSALLAGNLEEAREFMRSSIEMEPEYDKAYIYAESINSLAPDAEFGAYIAKMKAEHLPEAD